MTAEEIANQALQVLRQLVYEEITVYAAAFKLGELDYEMSKISQCNKITQQDIAETMPPRLGWEI